MTGLAPALALDTLIDYDWVVEEYGIMYVVEGDQHGLVLTCGDG